jgi:hypothetical protein
MHCFVPIKGVRNWQLPVGLFPCGIVVVLMILSPAYCVDDESEVRDALYGEWVIVRMVYRGKVQDSGGVPLGWIKIEKNSFAIADSDHRYAPKQPCTIGPRREIDILDRSLGKEQVIKALYHLDEEGELQVIWRNDYGERPSNFDALQDSRLTLYVLKKVT